MKKYTVSTEKATPSESIAFNMRNTAIEGSIRALLLKDVTTPCLTMNKLQIRAVLGAASKSNQPIVVRYYQTSIIASKQLAITQKIRYLE